MCGLLNLATNDFGNELGGKLLQGTARRLALHNLGHLLADRPDLSRAGVCRFLDLVASALGESNGEETEEVVIGGLDNNVAFDQGLPLADERSELVRGEVEAMEVGKTVSSLNLVHP